MSGLRPPATDADRLAWLRLARSRQVGPRTFAKLMARAGDVHAALALLPEVATGAGAADYEACPAAQAQAEIEAGIAAGARLICRGEPFYPAALDEIADPPPVLWARGHAGLPAEPCVAVVGARNASAAGRRLAAALARELGEAGWIVVSGLARGIDAAAHEAALPTGTVAVTAGGVDVVYPPENAALAARIAEEGLIVSEAPMGEAPVARSFPKRNRIVSGLSAGVVLVEAAARSGSLITARMALEQGREAMAVPGSPLDARAEGCNALIREGAALIRSAEDVIEALGTPRARSLRRATAPLLAELPPPRPARPGPAPSDDAAARVLALLGPTPVPVDVLGRMAGLGAAALSSVLLDLDLDGRIERRPGDLVVRAPEG